MINIQPIKNAVSMLACAISTLEHDEKCPSICQASVAAFRAVQFFQDQTVNAVFGGGSTSVISPILGYRIVRFLKAAQEWAYCVEVDGKTFSEEAFGPCLRLCRILLLQCEYLLGELATFYNAPARTQLQSRYRPIQYTLQITRCVVEGADVVMVVAQQSFFYQKEALGARAGALNLEQFKQRLMREYSQFQNVASTLPSGP